MALVLVSGLLVVVSLLSVFFLRMTVLAGAVSRGETLHRAAALTAESGMDYAAARLWDDPLPVPDAARTVANAADDWACRDLLFVPSPSASPNPSYRRGGHFKDLDLNGLYLPIADAPNAVTPFPPGWDPDGNGDFDAWSGRLRGAGGTEGPFANRFSLKVESLGGRVCINSGELGSPLGDHDLDGILNKDDTVPCAPIPGSNRMTEGYLEDADGNGVPDWRDVEFRGNRHLVNLLNNLGAAAGLQTQSVLFAPGDPGNPAAVPPIPPAPAIPELGKVVVSDLGDTVVKNRPRGGYGSIRDLKKFMSDEDFGRVAPFLSVEGEIVPVAFQGNHRDPEDGLGVAEWLHRPPYDGVPPAASMRKIMHGKRFLEPIPHYRVNYAYGWSEPPSPTPEVWYEFHARIDFNQAPLEILEASLAYLTASGTHRWGFHDGVRAPPIPVAETPFIRIRGNEAADIAQALHAHRPVHTWKQLLQVVHTQCAPLFRDDPYTWGVNEGADEEYKLLKEDLILAQFDANGYFADTLSWRANSLEVGREAVAQGLDGTRVRRIEKAFLAGPLTTAPWRADGQVLADGVETDPIDGPDTDVLEKDFGYGIPTRMTSEFSLAPQTAAFSIASEGAAGGRARVLLQSDLRLDQFLLSGQQDFEGLRRSVSHPGVSGEAWRFSGGRILTEPDAGSGLALSTRDGVQSLPKFPLSSYAARALPPDCHMYPRVSGSLVLSANPAPGGIPSPPGMVYAWAFNEDTPGSPTDTMLDNFLDPSGSIRGKLNHDSARDGISLSPFGVRYSWSERVGNLPTDPVPQPGMFRLYNLTPAQPRLEWGPPDPSPFPQGDFIPSLMAPRVEEKGPYQEGTIAFWFPAYGSEAFYRDEARPDLQLSYEIAGGTHREWRDLLRVVLQPEQDGVWLWSQWERGGSTDETTVVQPTRYAAPWTGKSQWVHVAIRFFDPPQPDDHDNSFMAEVFLDGRKAGEHELRMEEKVIIAGGGGGVPGGPGVPGGGGGGGWLPGPGSKGGGVFLCAGGVPLPPPGGGPGGDPGDDEEPPVHVVPNGNGRLQLNGPVDDVLVFSRSLADGEIEKLAREPRHRVAGTWVSPRYRFDPERLSRGGAIQAVSWDGFIPQETGGRITFEVRGYDAAGNPTPGDPITWDWKDQEGDAIPFARVPSVHCRSFDIKVTMEAMNTDPDGRWTDAWPLVTGERTLRDTPRLEEIRVHYAAGRPGWNDYLRR